MNLLEKIGLTIAGKTKSNETITTDSYTDALGVPADPNSRQLGYSYRNITYSAISLIATGFSCVENYCVDSKDKNKRIKHQFLSVMENPNKDMTKSELQEAHMTFMKMWGESFWYFSLGEQTGKPKEIYLIRPDRIKIITDKGAIVAYKLEMGPGKYILLHPDEVYHHKYFNPNNQWRGLGPLQAGLEYVQTEELATNFTKNSIHNNATPSGVISLKTAQGNGEVSKEAYDKFKRGWSDGMTGSKNAGKVAIVRGMEVSFERIGMSLENIDLEKLRKVTDEAILKMFRVPKGLLGESDQTGLGRGNIEALEYIFSKWTIEPEAKKYDDSIQKMIKRFYKDDVVVKHENIIPEDKEYELNYKKESVGKWITADEIREEEGRVRVGADSIYSTMNQVPVNTKPSTSSKSYKVTRSIEKEDNYTWDVNDHSETAKHEIFRKNTTENLVEPYVVKFKKEVNKILKEQEDKVLSKIGKSVTAKELEDTNLDIAEETLKMVAALYPVVYSLALDAGNEALQFVGADQVFDIDLAYQKLIKEHITRMSYNYTDDTIKSLSETLAQGILGSESSKELRDRVKTVFKVAETWRNERIARNETHWTSVNATEQAWKQSEVIKYKQWYVNPGACKYCSTFSGKVEAIGSTFASKGTKVTADDGSEYTLEYEDIENAHLHPNCKCQILPLASNKSYKGLDIKVIDNSEIIEKKSVEDIINEKFSTGLDSLKESLNNEVKGKVAEFESATNRLKEVLDGEQ